jgi:ribosomal protein S18 acetylase RimI-like enzyme
MPDPRPTLIIRPARENDLPEIQRVDLEAFPAEPYPFFVLRQLFDLYGDHLIVLDDGTALQGYVIAAATSACGPAWLISLGVAQEHRGRGLARRLALEMIHRLRAEGTRELRLTVAPANQPAVHLYRSLGFTPLGDPHKDYFGPGQDRLLMALALRR